MSTLPLVSVCMITYKHESFIAQAIEGVLMQKTNFSIELIIGEDCGPDNTRDICSGYAEKYPNIIKLNFLDNNVGAQNNFVNTISLCTGRYIAICEGDDYWTDPYKLQKQVNFMEEHPEYSLCAHNAEVLWYDKEFRTRPTFSKFEFSTSDLINEDWAFMTATILLKRSGLVLPEWYRSINNGDYGLQLLLSLNGAVGYMPDTMSVYRRHYGGITSTFNPFFSATSMHNVLTHFDQYTNGKFRENIRVKLNQFYKNSLINARTNKLKKQVLALSCISFFYNKLGVDILPLFARIPLFYK